MRYIIMCGGSYPKWETPRQLTEFNGETLTGRTIRLLKEFGIKDISISSNDKRFDIFNVPVLNHVNQYVSRGYNDSDGYWCEAFYPTEEPTTYLFGDVYFSPSAIETIINTDTDDIMFFGSAPPFAPEYPKPYIEPFAFKVVNVPHLRDAIETFKKYKDAGLFNRDPMSWELWSIIKGTNVNEIDYSYVHINDYTCDIDYPREIEGIKRSIETIW